MTKFWSRRKFKAEKPLWEFWAKNHFQSSRCGPTRACTTIKASIPLVRRSTYVRRRSKSRSRYASRKPRWQLARRFRMAAVALGSIFAAVAAVFLGWRATDWALKLLLYENQVFAIQNIDAQSDGVIAPQQIRRWSGVRPGQNLFALDLAGVRRN